MRLNTGGVPSQVAAFGRTQQELCPSFPRPLLTSPALGGEKCASCQGWTYQHPEVLRKVQGSATGWNQHGL